jgi:hypothetical protein
VGVSVDTSNAWIDSIRDLESLQNAGALTIDQQLKVAEVKALLAIGQELSRIRDEGIGVNAKPVQP